MNRVKPLKVVGPKERYIYVRPQKPRKLKLTKNQWASLISYEARLVDIVIAKLDERCPKCNATTAPTKVRDDGLVRRGDFDIGKEHGKVFGARCGWCGWSF